MIYKDFAQECHALKNVGDIKNFIKVRVGSLIPHEMALCGIGDLKRQAIIRFINIGYPDQFLRFCVHPDQAIRSDVTLKWLKKREPIIYDESQENTDKNINWLNVAKANKVKTIASHGLVDPFNQYFSYFSFGNIDTSTCDEINKSLIEIIPYLHYALARTLTTPFVAHDTCDDTDGSCAEINLCEQKGSLTFLTPREQEMMKFIALGKSNLEIAQILGISHYTVSNHIKSIFKRLDVVNRAQAVSKIKSPSLAN